MKTPDEFKKDVYEKSKVYTNKRKKTKRAVLSCFALLLCTGMVFTAIKNMPEYDAENGFTADEGTKSYGYSKEDKAIDGYEKKPESKSEPDTFIPGLTSEEAIIEIIEKFPEGELSKEVFVEESEELSVESGEEPENHSFEAFDLQSFFDFINNGGNIPGGHLWSEYAENAEFIEWVNGKAQIPVPVTASGFKVTCSCVGEKEYCFYISTSNEKLMAQVIIEEILPDQTADLSEIVRHYMAESGKAYYEADGEHISGECKFGEYVLYDRHPCKSEFQGEETTSICPPILFFRYGDYLVRVTDRRNPEAEKWDIHFLDCFDLEMYEIQRNRQDK